jgi:hypothetical protein
MRTRVFLSDPHPQYPELANPRYSPTSHPVGVCFSGGGPRAMSAGMGQMRALLRSPLYDLIGAISCVSGGSWFGSIFSYTKATIDDEDLLGPITAPNTITLASARRMPRKRLAWGLTHNDNERITDVVTSEYLSGTPINRLYARMLNATLLSPFGIDRVKRFFALDDASVAAILANNPELTASDFYKMRANRPYFIAGATQIYPTDEHLIMRHFEYSPLYNGTPQLFANGSPKGAFGGGFVENFAFDSSAPQKPDAQGLINVSAPLHRFTISDLMGSSGAAPGSVLDMLGLPSLFAEFHYWAPGSAGATPDPTVRKMSIVDGGDLENTGIVALLQRQYPVIVVCVNTSTKMNQPDATYEGIDTQIAALFGYTPKVTRATTEVRSPARSLGLQKAPALAMANVDAAMPNALKISIPQQPIQVFPREDFAAVRDGLKNALKGGGVVYFASEHRIYDRNPFGIPPYPNDGKVKVVWLYNERIAQWVSQLQPEVARFLDSKSKTEFMANFPNYDTVEQNSDFLGIKELLLLTPRQVNLLADMWTWAVMQIEDDIRKLVG